MTISKDTFKGATAHTMHVSSTEILRSMSAAARDRALEAFTAALVRPDALEFAEALAEPLEKARAAAVEPEAAVAAAKQALAEEQKGVAGRLVAFWQSKRRGDPDDREREPVKETEEVQALKAALAAAEREAQPFTQRVRYHEGQIAGLRAAPSPDPAVLAIMAEVLIGGHHDVD